MQHIGIYWNLQTGLARPEKSSGPGPGPGPGLKSFGSGSFGSASGSLTSGPKKFPSQKK